MNAIRRPVRIFCGAAFCARRGSLYRDFHRIAAEKLRGSKDFKYRFEKIYIIFNIHKIKQENDKISVLHENNPNNCAKKLLIIAISLFILIQKKGLFF